MQHDFFQVLTVEDVVSLLSSFPPLEAETVRLDDLPQGRVLAADVSARDDVPLASRAGMDGYAVRAADTFGVTESNPVYLDCVAHLEISAIGGFRLQAGQCAGIVTGGILPAGANAVVMVEHTRPMGENCVEVSKSVAPGAHVMWRAEDAKAGAVVLPAGTPLRTQEVGLLAAVGAVEVSVRRQPLVAILSTGDELLPAGGTPRPGQVRDVNSHTLACQVRAAGGQPWRLGIVPDRVEALGEALTRGLERADVVLLSGGSSVGVRDFTVAALRGLPDAELLCHGVALAPGKPLILARVGGKCVWGLPGQITSAQVVMMILGQPFLRHLAGYAEPFRQDRWPCRRAELARNTASQQGREDYVRVRLEDRPGQLPLAVPIPGMSGLLRTLLGAHGVIRIPAGVEGLEGGVAVDVLPFA